MIKIKDKINYEDLLVAFYEYGNLNDSLETIHNENGKPILKEDEYMMSEVNNVRCHIYTTRNPSSWSGYNGLPIFLECGEGTLYRTNKRLIYIREPQPLQHIYHTSGPGLTSALPRSMWAKEWKKLGLKECFSLPINLIVKYEKITFKLGFYIYIQGKEKRYMLTIAPYKETLKCINDLIDKLPRVKKWYERVIIWK